MAHSWTRSVKKLEWGQPQAQQESKAAKQLLIDKPKWECNQWPNKTKKMQTKNLY
jgi:hypothetical protein